MAFTKQEKAHIKALPTLGYWSSLGGVEIKRFEDTDGETYVICIINAWGWKSSYHRLRIKYTHTKDARPYIEFEGVKLYLDQCIRSRM